MSSRYYQSKILDDLMEEITPEEQKRTDEQMKVELKVIHKKALRGVIFTVIGYSIFIAGVVYLYLKIK